MSSKKILTVGFELASDKVESVDLRTKQSLLDANIILFKPDTTNLVYPDITNLVFYEKTYKGKPRLEDHCSFRYTEMCEYWNQQIRLAIEAGRTIIVFASSLIEVYVDTGKRTYSGKGRNEKAKILVQKYDNYRILPMKLKPFETYGTEMRLTPKKKGLLGPYWNEFGHHSRYKVIFEDPDLCSCVNTRDGKGTVGVIYRSRTSTGTLLVLPDIDFESDAFFVEENEELTFTSWAYKFSAQLLKTVIALDKRLQSQLEGTPTPSWVLGTEYVLEPETKIQKDLCEAVEEETVARSNRENLEKRLETTRMYKALLYEKGLPLEHAIIEALKVMNFNATSFADSHSQFDVVFDSEEGRLIGEAEGKDNKAVGIEKLRQLNFNIQEDLAREDVTMPAKPVLFGNPYRLQELKDRGEPFTDKCVAATRVSSAALVYTPDLFRVVQSLLFNDDPRYAKKCRLKMLNTIGRVTFPTAPNLRIEDS